MIQVSTTLENIPNLAELRHVDSVIPVGKGVLTKLSSFTQEFNPYIGEFPLLLNETISLVEADDDNTTGTGVIIAILSTGIDEIHPMAVRLPLRNETHHFPAAVSFCFSSFSISLP